MSDVRSLEFQQSCVTHLIALCEKIADDTVLDGARQAAKSLAWLNKRANLTRELVRLERDRPDLAKSFYAIFASFPQARVEDVRNSSGPIGVVWVDGPANPDDAMEASYGE